MTVAGFKKAYDPSTFYLFKTTGNVDHYAANIKGELEIDDVNEIVSYTDISGYRFIVDINDIAIVSCLPTN